MTTTKEPKMSKQGWPLGKFEHRLGTTDKSSAKTLAPLLKTRYQVAVTFKPFGGSEFYGELIAEPCRLSMETYGLIRAFVDGFNANRC